MPDVNILRVLISGDLGGAGISRFACQNAGFTALSPTEAGAAGDALYTMYLALAGHLQGVTATVDSTFQTVDVASGALVSEGIVGATLSVVVGLGVRPCPAGTGARGYWHTSTVKGRRFIRGATFFTTFDNESYAGNNALSTTTIGDVELAMNNYAADLLAAGLTAVIWSRPTPLAPASGVAAPVVAFSCSPTPCALRSRRM
jgi:hypothetical protein